MTRHIYDLPLFTHARFVWEQEMKVAAAVTDTLVEKNNVPFFTERCDKLK